MLLTSRPKGFAKKIMNFHELKIIVGQIKRTMRCPECDGKYTDETIEVIGSINQDESFFHAYCPNCEDESCIHVDNGPEPLCEEHARLGNAPRMEHISSNEVLDMHNFLKSFGGNFDEMFKEEKSA